MSKDGEIRFFRYSKLRYVEELYCRRNLESEGELALLPGLSKSVQCEYYP